MAAEAMATAEAAKEQAARLAVGSGEVKRANKSKVWVVAKPSSLYLPADGCSRLRGFCVADHTAYCAIYCVLL